MKLKFFIYIFCISKKYLWHLFICQLSHSTITKFPTLEISNEWGGGFTYVPYNIFRGIYVARCSSFETKRQFTFSK